MIDEREQFEWCPACGAWIDSRNFGIVPDRAGVAIRDMTGGGMQEVVVSSCFVSKKPAFRLGEASGRSRWRLILAAAKIYQMDSLMLRNCITLAMLRPEMPGEAVVAQVKQNATTVPNTVEHNDTNVVRLFAKAS